MSTHPEPGVGRQSQLWKVPAPQWCDTSDPEEALWILRREEARWAASEKKCHLSRCVLAGQV